MSPLLSWAFLLTTVALVMWASYEATLGRQRRRMTYGQVMPLVWSNDDPDKWDYSGWEAGFDDEYDTDDRHWPDA